MDGSIQIQGGTQKTSLQAVLATQGTGRRTAQRTYYVPRTIIPSSHLVSPGHRELKSLAQGHTGRGYHSCFGAAETEAQREKHHSYRGFSGPCGYQESDAGPAFTTVWWGDRHKYIP